MKSPTFQQLQYHAGQRAALEKALGEHFIPVVSYVVDQLLVEINASRARSIHFNKDKDTVRASYAVTFVETMSTGDMYHLSVKLEGHFTLDDWSSLSAILARFTYHDHDAERIGGRLTILGDGDDLYAVTLQDGKFNIWLRQWFV